MINYYFYSLTILSKFIWWAFLKINPLNNCLITLFEWFQDTILKVVNIFWNYFSYLSFYFDWFHFIKFLSYDFFSLNFESTYLLLKFIFFKFKVSLLIYCVSSITKQCILMYFKIFIDIMLILYAVALYILFLLLFLF